MPTTTSSVEPPRYLGAAAAVVFSAVLLFSLPLLLNDALPQGADVGFASMMSVSTADALRDGIWLPSWSDTMNRGLGGPAPTFYSPVAYFSTALVSFLTGDVLVSMRFAVVLGAVLGALGFYCAVRARCTPIGAGVGAALYLLLPYHMIDLYDRFAFAELASFVWLPPALYFLRETIGRRSLGSAVGLGICGAGLALTHSGMAYLALLAFAPPALFWFARDRRWTALWLVAAAALAALLLAAFYLVPAILDRDLTHFEYLQQSGGDWRRNFAFSDEVALGFGEAKIKPLVERSLLTQAGLAALALAAVLLRRSKARSDAWPLAAASAWVVFLQLPPSAPLWEYLPGLASASFPWRFGAFQLLFSSWLAALALGAPGRVGARRAAALALVVVGAVPALSLSAELPNRREYTFDSSAAIEAASDVTREYVPVSCRIWKRLHARPVRAGATLEGGPGRVETVEWTTHARRFVVDADGPRRLIVRTFVYPNWQARVDGEPVAILPADRSGAIAIDLPAGRREVTLAFLPGRSRRLGAGLSGVGSVLLLVAIGLHLRTRGRHDPTIYN